jgi:hypothetical protein
MGWSEWFGGLVPDGGFEERWSRKATTKATAGSHEELLEQNQISHAQA